MVDAIWSDMDLRYSPAVERLPGHASATIARANRLSLFLSDPIPAWCLLHEITHAMTTTADGLADGHGPNFMGIYLRLLVRYLRCDEKEMRRSLQEAAIIVARDARPVFLDH
jgi:hypothetical protein